MNRGLILYAAGCALLGTMGVGTAVSFRDVGASNVANLACRIGDGGGYATTAAALFTGTAGSALSPGRLIDGQGGEGIWTVTGMGSANDTATATIDLGEIWNINKIHTEYQWWQSLPSQYELSVSTDGSTWNTVVSATAPTENVTNTFAARDARYISWKMWGGSGATIGPMELMAFAASTAPTKPQLNQGFNILPNVTDGNVTQTIYDAGPPVVPGFISWGNALAMKDLNFHTDGAVNVGPTEAVFNLGASYLISRIQTSYYAAWDSSQLAVSTDNINWTIVKALGGPSSGAIYEFAPMQAQYIRVAGTMGASNGHLRELAVFTFVPEPATLSLLVLAGMTVLARRRR